jgi:signal transduction histidine kinase/ActR/RegA family two-component response regulator
MPTNNTEERILILAPVGQDAAAMSTLFHAHGCVARVCTTAGEVCDQLKAGSAVLLMTEEALELPQIPDVLHELDAQPPWSELPLIVLTRGGESQLARLLNLMVKAAGSMTLLERPLGQATLLRSIEVAVQSRRRQYQVRDLLVQQHKFAEELERKVAERTQQLVSSQDQLRALATELNLAEQRERKRVATELHDHLAQMLVLILLKLGESKKGPLHRSQEMIIQAEKLVNDSLTYTRDLMVELSPPVLREFGLFAALRWLVGQPMQRYGLTVTVETHSPEELQLPEDQAVLLFQSVRELLINVAKHAASKQASIVAEEREGCLRIVVEDKGVGFDLLAMATQKNSPLSSKFGLFSIRERMKVMGGRFEFHSAPGQGTRAALVLPLSPRSQQALAQRAVNMSMPEALADRNQSRLGQGPCRVLIADDHAMVRQGLRSLLEGFPNIEVIGEASNGAEAVDLTEQLKPAAVVMDINMPLMNGIVATAKIKQGHPEIVVIGLSVNASTDNQDAMQKAGASLLLTKEAAVEQLYGAIQQAVNGIALLE